MVVGRVSALQHTRREREPPPPGRPPATRRSSTAEKGGGGPAPVALPPRPTGVTLRPGRGGGTGTRREGADHARERTGHAGDRRSRPRSCHDAGVHVVITFGRPLLPSGLRVFDPNELWPVHPIVESLGEVIRNMRRWNGGGIGGTERKPDLERGR
jgi:hypothetical protein